MIGSGDRSPVRRRELYREGEGDNLGGESIADVIGKILNGTALGDVALKTLGTVSAASAASRALSSGMVTKQGLGNGPVR